MKVSVIYFLHGASHMNLAGVLKAVICELNN